MRDLFLVHNTHQAGIEAFTTRDPNLRRLQQQTLQHPPTLTVALPREVPGIYTLGGARQVGKTTC